MDTTPVSLPIEPEALFPAQAQQVIDQADHTVLGSARTPDELARREWRPIIVHREPVLPRLATGLLEVGDRSSLA